MKLINTLMLLITTCVITPDTASNLSQTFYYNRTTNGAEYGKIEVTRFYLDVFSSGKYNHYFFKENGKDVDGNYFTSTNNDTIKFVTDNREIVINGFTYYINSNIDLDWWD